MSVTTGQVTAGDGCRIAYRFDGPADAPVVMLSNSLGTRLEMWDAQVAALSARYRLLRYDSRGHGWSAVPAGDYTIERLARDAVDLLDRLALERVAFCGLSMGGMVGQWLGANAPERLTRLVLANTSAFMGPPSGWDARIATVRESGMAAIADAVLDRWFTPAFRAAPSADVTAVRDMLLATDPVGYAGCCAAIRDMDLRAASARIAVPTLMITGAQDPATPPSDGAAIVAAARDARLVPLDAAHLSNIERPAEFSAVVGDFLA